MRQQVAQSGVVDLCLQHVELCHCSTPIIPLSITSLFLSPFWRPHSVCGTEVILLLDICDWSVANGLVCGPHVEWRRCPPFVQFFFFFLVLDTNHQMSGRAWGELFWYCFYPALRWYCPSENLWTWSMPCFSPPTFDIALSLMPKCAMLLHSLPPDNIPYWNFGSL